MAWFMLSLLKCNNYENCDLDSIQNHQFQGTLLYMYIIYLLFSVNSEPSAPRYPCIIRGNTDGIELNWIPPLEPNRDVYYLIEYNDGNRTVPLNTSSRSTYFNLTGLQRGVTYNITVVAVNSAGRSDTDPFLNYTHSPQSK